MVQVYLLGPMEDATKESIMTIKSMEKEHSHGLTEESTLEIGPMENNMGKEHLWQSMDNKGMENGVSEKESDGLMVNESLLCFVIIIRAYYDKTQNFKFERRIRAKRSFYPELFTH